MCVCVCVCVFVALLSYRFLVPVLRLMFGPWLEEYMMRADSSSSAIASGSGVIDHHY